MVCWFHGWRRSTGLPSGSLRDEHLLVFPVVVEGAAEQDADAEVDLHQVGGDQLAVDDDAGGDEHRCGPSSVMSRYLKLQTSGSWNEPQQPSRMRRLPDLLVAGHRLVEEVEQVVVHRHDALEELDVAHQAGQVVGEELDRGDRARRRRDRASTGGRGALPSGRTSRACSGSSAAPRGRTRPRAGSPPS